MAAVAHDDGGFLRGGAGESHCQVRRPGVFNTERGSQFTSAEWTGVLKEAGVAISMDGKGRWIDNVFIERLWRVVKSEERPTCMPTTTVLTRMGLTKYFSFYNTRRSHQGLDYRTPDDVYSTGLMATIAKAA